MTQAGNAFLKTFGPPNPRTESGLTYSSDAEGSIWRALYKDIGAGYYWDRFLFLFGTGIEELTPILKLWSFLIPQDDAERMIIGRNAYGVLLVHENPNASDPSSRVALLDPIAVTYDRPRDLDFVGLIGYWLPQKELPQFLDRTLYDEWRKSSGRYLEPGKILAPKTPLGLGGTMELDNFQEEEILAYYRTTAPIYQKAFAKMAARKAKKPAKPKAGGKKGRRH